MASIGKTAPGLALALWCAAGGAVASAGEGLAFFENEVRPILVAHCYECHSEEAGSQKGGLWLDRRAGWQEGGDAGPALVPGDPLASLLIQSVRYADPDLQMPPKTRLSEEQVAALERWVAMGAPDPRDETLAGAVRREEIDFEEARRYWAFRPLASPALPEVQAEDWAWSPADRFVLARLEAEGLAPAPDAAPLALLRRVFYDLTGLPPTPGEAAAFAADPSRERFASLVDDLLSRPAFGEKWGRHWLDLARYADSNGADRNYTYYQAWRYRNYVIDAFNRDKPYGEFVREQIAGDLLPAASPAQRREQLVASTFLTLGPKMLTERDKEKLWLDTADEQIDTLGRAFLGLTLGCARCHDHKFDPVSQEDYTALAGIFRSTETVGGTRNGCVNVASWVEVPLDAETPEGEALAAQVERLELAMRLTVQKSFREKAGAGGHDLPWSGIIYDDAQATLEGEWKASSHSPSRYGESYLHDNQAGAGQARAVFRGTVPEDGIYEVRLAYNAGANRASQVPVTVEAREGASQVILDQRRQPSVGGLFEPLGRFSFEKGRPAVVIVGTPDAGDGYVIVDAVQLIAERDVPVEARALAAAGRGEEDPLYRMSQGDLRKELDKMIEELKDADLAMAPREARDAGDSRLRVRGEVHQPAEVVPRRFPLALHDGPVPEIAPGASGRDELARWMAGPGNPLLERVMANRVWQHLFSRGIVATVDNFGVLGDPPTHPELLEHLAAAFSASGGSVKGLVRDLVLSRAYQLSCDSPEALAQADPANRLFGRQNRRRLAAEEFRDSALWLAGSLDLSPGGATATLVGVDLDKRIDFSREHLRTVYLPVARNNLAPELEIFDAPNPELVTGERPLTVVPTQALYLLNSGFLMEQAAALAARIVPGLAPPDAVAGLYQAILYRAPREDELAHALELVEALSGGAGGGEGLEEACGHLAHLLLASTEFLFLD